MRCEFSAAVPVRLLCKAAAACWLLSALPLLSPSVAAVMVSCADADTVAVSVAVGSEALPMPETVAIVPDTMPLRQQSLSLHERVMRSVDRLFDRRDSRERQGVDTAWRVRSSERLRLKMCQNTSGASIILRGKDGDAAYKAKLATQNKYTLSLGASYRGLSASIALSPTHVTGKSHDVEFNLNAYGNRLGADVVYQSAKTLEGYAETAAGQVDVPQGLVRQQTLALDAYYVLNARRFSYPAAFTQSWVQRRSCGSFMLGMMVYGMRLTAERSEAVGFAAMRMTMVCGAVGAGYGYNLVTRRRWLFHISSLPQVVVFNRSRLTTDGYEGKMPYRFPNVMAVGRLAVVRHYDRWFAGLSAVVTTVALGDTDRLSVQNMKWRARLFVGLKVF